METTEATTLIMGRVPDQAALHGILAQIRDLGLVLVSVQRLIEVDERHPNPAQRRSQAKPDEAECSPFHRNTGVST